MRSRLWSAVVALLAAAGVLERAVVLHGRWGAVDSDEAVVGLMARGFRHGHFRAFYWGQHYAGTQETALVALAGASVTALKLVPVALCAVAAVLTWRVGRRMIDERAAQVGGLLVWIAPGSFVWWSTKERGFYWATLVLGLVVVLAAQRLVTGGGRFADWVLLGLAGGLGFWASPTILYFAVPSGIWLLARRRPPLRWLGAGLAAAVLGALPWLWHNIGHGWPSLDRPPQPEHVGYVAGVGRLLWRTFPIALGLRLPIDEQWVIRGVAPVALILLGIAVVVAAARRSERPALLLGSLAAFPLIYAWFPGAWFVGEGRYALFASPLLALTLAWVVRRPPLLLGLGLLALLGAVVALDHLGYEPPERIGGDLAALERAGVDHLWADYWVAYRIGFVSDGRIVASSRVSSRERAVHDAVLGDPTPAFLYFRGDPRLARLEAALKLPHHRIRTPHFVGLLVDGPVDVADLPPGLVP